MNKLDHEEFKIYLEGDSNLSRDYAKLSKEEPSSDLDNVILEHARNEIKNKSNINPDNVTQIKITFFSRRLDSPLAMAAVIVLCISLVLLAQQNMLEEEVGEAIPESLPMTTDEADQIIQQESEQKTINRLSPAAASETSKPDVMVRARKESFSEKKELQKRAPMEEAQFNEAQISEERISAPASTPVYQYEKKQKTRQGQLKDDAGISSGVAPQGMLKMETEQAKRQLRNDSILADQTSPEALSKQIKLLIQQDKIEEAKVLYQQFIELFPEQPPGEWFRRSEISLLLER